MLLTKIYDYLDKSFWFIPAIFISFPFIILYLIFLFGFQDNTLNSQYVFLLHIVENPDAAKIILGTIAGSVISIISISFSITMVVLSIASQQYSPRLLQNFMRKNDTKIILGIFISTFLYCLIAIGLIYKNSGYEAITTVLAFVGLLLGIISLLAFIYFINYVIQTISLSNIINGIHNDIQSTFEKFYSDKLMPDEIEDEFYKMTLTQVIYSIETGYFQSMDQNELIEIASSFGIVLQLLYQPGDYVIANIPLVKVFYCENAISPMQARKVLNQMLFGNERKVGQDILFPISQIVEIAVRALSPGINDPRTAINCIDVLTKPLAFLFTRNRMISKVSKNKKLCLIRVVNSERQIIKACFRTIFDNAKSNRLVLGGLCNSLSKLLKSPLSLEFRDALIIELNIIRQNAELSDFDMQEIVSLFKTEEIPVLNEKIN